MLIVGERKRFALRHFCEEMPAHYTESLDFDLFREVVTGGTGGARPLPEIFGIAAVAFSRSRAALDEFLSHLELSNDGD